MEMMPNHRPRVSDATFTPSSLPTWGPEAARDWREGLPVLQGLGFTLRELRASDAPSLVAHLTPDEVTRFISPPPATVDGFERFIAWTHRERAAGRYACYAIVPEGQTAAVGLFQLRRLEGRHDVAEWGFILGAAYWGTGLFVSGAQKVVDFAFDIMGVHRLEARAAVLNGRGNGALAKLGAVREAVLRQSFERHGERLDQHLWGLSRLDWDAVRRPRPRLVRGVH
jgi:[ribosomal protein S5]-alanine N-acetyltransferase